MLALERGGWGNSAYRRARVGALTFLLLLIIAWANVRGQHSYAGAETCGDVQEREDALADIRRQMEPVPTNRAGDWTGAVLERIFADLPFGLPETITIMGATDHLLRFR